jgi:hypothetical protein
MEDAKMTIWFHSTILATGLAATVAVGIAGAAVYNGFDAPIAPKADRLPAAKLDAGKSFVTVETRGDGVSVLSRLPVTMQAAN